MNKFKLMELISPQPVNFILRSFSTMVGLGSKSILKTNMNILKVQNFTLAIKTYYLVLKARITKVYANT